MALFLFVVIVAIALGIIGAVIKGLIYLLVIGIIVLVVDLVLLGGRLRGRRRRPSR
ncbi:MAG TPA: hypothetical protein VG184_05075 [Acidimicrobiales bacterium]|jgi:hypothetical protein|nr:hypothetical protein [Acidimicrobiales bacterium]